MHEPYIIFGIRILKNGKLGFQSQPQTQVSYILYEFLTETGHPAGDTFKIHLNNKSSSVMTGSRLEIHQKDLFG